MKVETEEDGKDSRGRTKYKLKDPFARFEVADIDYDDNRKINKLVIVESKTKEVVYTYGANAKKTTKETTKATKEPTKPQAPKADTPPQNAQAPQSAQLPQNTTKNVVVETVPFIPDENEKPHERVFKDFLNRHKIDRNNFIAMRADALKAGKPVTDKKFSELDQGEWITLIATMDGLYEEGFFKDVA